MTDQDYSHIALVLDRSGSMAGIASDMDGGVKTFLEDQLKLPGTFTVDVTLFDNKIEKPHDNAAVADITWPLIKPRGGTALYDAVGSTIVSLGEKLAALPEERRPENVIVVIVTDGYENSSVDWSGTKVAELIKEQEEKWNWNFVFLGANIDAFAEGSKFGISKGNSLGYVADSQGVAFAAAAASTYVTRTRSGLATTLAEAAEDVLQGSGNTV